MAGSRRATVERKTMRVTFHAPSGFMMAVLGTAFFVALAQAGEWHTGHQVRYRSACHDKAKMTAVAEAAEVSLRAANEHFTRLVREDTNHRYALLLRRPEGMHGLLRGQEEVPADEGCARNAKNLRGSY